MDVGVESIHSTVQAMEDGLDVQMLTQIETSMYYRAHDFIMITTQTKTSIRSLSMS